MITERLMKQCFFCYPDAEWDIQCRLTMLSSCVTLAVVPSDTGKATSPRSSRDGGIVAPVKRPVIVTATATAE